MNTLAYKNRLFSFDLIRAIATIMIIVFHFNMFINQYAISNLPTKVGNLYLGDLGVSLFFILSGAALMYSHLNHFNIKKYVHKRIVSIYPLFYISYGLTFFYFFYKSGGMFIHAPKWCFIFTLLGLDGYLHNVVPTFYILGEWFLGCIIIIYIFFPLLRWCIMNHPKLTAAAAVIYYCIIIYLMSINDFIIPFNQSAAYRITDFILGMYLARQLTRISKLSFPYILILIAIGAFMPFCQLLPQEIRLTLMSGATFVLLTFLGTLINNSYIKGAAYSISKHSYPIFLMHHFIIIEVLKKFIGTHLGNLEILCSFILVNVLIGAVTYLVEKIELGICKWKETCS